MPAPKVKTPRMISGASAALASRMVSRLFGLLFVMYLARKASPAEFASYNYLLVLAATVIVVLDTGSALVGNREVASGALRLDVAYRAVAPIQATTSVLAGIAVLLVSLLWPGPVSGRAPVVCVAVYITLNGIFDGQTELIRGSGRPWTEAWLQLASGVTQAAVGVATVALGGGLTALMATMAVKQAVFVLVTQIWLPSPFGPFDRDALKGLLRRGLWIGGASTIGAFGGRAPQLVLGNLASVNDVAIFAVAARFLEIVTTACQTSALGLLPALSHRAEKSDSKAFMRRVYAIVIGGSILVSLIALPLLQPVIDTVFGARYAGAADAARVFIIGLPLVMLRYLAWFSLVAFRAERKTTAASIAGGIGTAAFTVFIFISPKPVPAAIATIAGFAVAAVVGTWFVARTARGEGRPLADPFPASQPAAREVAPAADRS